MRVAAVIAELNPFHNGHAYLLQEARRAGAQRVAVIMSGSFVQRGEPALFDKWVRAGAALRCGADLVLELPLPYAVSGAQRFARGAVALCEALGTADTLAFGCEAPPQALLQARRLLQSPRLPGLIRDALRAQPGIPFAAARTEALAALGGQQLAGVLKQPNNALALEYLAALEEGGSRLSPLPICRVGTAHDAGSAAGGFASASLLRGRFWQKGPEALAPYVPPEALALYQRAPFLDRPAFEAAMLSRLRMLPPEALARLPELSEGLEHRLYAAIREARTLPELYSRMKSKRYTHARMRRLALAAFLGLEERHTLAPPPYLRILGYTAAGRELLGRAALPMNGSLRRLGEAGALCGEFARLEAAAGDQYALCSIPRAGCGREYTAGVLRV